MVCGDEQLPHLLKPLTCGLRGCEGYADGRTCYRCACKYVESCIASSEDVACACQRSVSLESIEALDDVGLTERVLYAASSKQHLQSFAAFRCPSPNCSSLLPTVGGLVSTVNGALYVHCGGCGRPACQKCRQPYSAHVELSIACNDKGNMCARLRARAVDKEYASRESVRRAAGGSGGSGSAVKLTPCCHQAFVKDNCNVVTCTTCNVLFCHLCCKVLCSKQEMIADSAAKGNNARAVAHAHFRPLDQV
jgi:hypothetical protein